MLICNHKVKGSIQVMERFIQLLIQLRLKIGLERAADRLSRLNFINVCFYNSDQLY